VQNEAGIIRARRVQLHAETALDRCDDVLYSPEEQRCSPIGLITGGVQEMHREEDRFLCGEVGLRTGADKLGHCCRRGKLLRVEDSKFRRRGDGDPNGVLHALQHVLDVINNRERQAAPEAPPQAALCLVDG